MKKIYVFVMFSRKLSYIYFSDKKIRIFKFCYIYRFFSVDKFGKGKFFKKFFRSFKEKVVFGVVEKYILFFVYFKS